MEKVTCYQTLNKFSLFNTHFVFLDTGDYLADGLFIKHQVRVHFGDELEKPGIPYRIIFCHVRKWDEERFRTAMSELPDKMLLCGKSDYLGVCKDIWEKGGFCDEDGAAEQTQ